MVDVQQAVGFRYDGLEGGWEGVVIGDCVLLEGLEGGLDVLQNLLLGVDEWCIAEGLPLGD